MASKNLPPPPSYEAAVSYSSAGPSGSNYAQPSAPPLEGTSHGGVATPSPPPYKKKESSSSSSSSSDLQQITVEPQNTNDIIDEAEDPVSAI